MSAPSDRLTRALSLLDSLEPGAPERVQGNLDAFHPDTTELVLGYAFADVVGRDGIDLKTREMMTIAMLAAMATSLPRACWPMTVTATWSVMPTASP